MSGGMLGGKSSIYVFYSDPLPNCCCPWIIPNSSIKSDGNKFSSFLHNLVSGGQNASYFIYCLYVCKLILNM